MTTKPQNYPTHTEADTLSRIDSIPRCTSLLLSQAARITQATAVQRLKRVYLAGWAAREQGHFEDRAAPVGGRLPWIYRLTRSGRAALAKPSVRQNGAKPRGMDPHRLLETLRAVDGTTAREVAEAVGISYAGAHNRLNRLRQFVSCDQRSRNVGSLWFLTEAGEHEIARLDRRIGGKE